MTIRVGVAEAKARLSELLNRVAYGGERVIITRHGKPVAEVSSVRVQAEPTDENPYPDHWINRIAGACADDPEYCDILDEIVADRVNQMPRDYDLPGDERDDSA